VHRRNRDPLRVLEAASTFATATTRLERDKARQQPPAGLCPFLLLSHGLRQAAETFTAQPWDAVRDQVALHRPKTVSDSQNHGTRCQRVPRWKSLNSNTLWKRPFFQFSCSCQ
jgi:hypothetical protein